MVKAIWKIEEKIPGGNNNIRVSFGYGKKQGANFASAFSILYHSNDGLDWDLSSTNPLLMCTRNY